MKIAESDVFFKATSGNKRLLLEHSHIIAEQLPGH